MKTTKTVTKKTSIKSRQAELAEEIAQKQAEMGALAKQVAFAEISSEKSLQIEYFLNLADYLPELCFDNEDENYTVSFEGNTDGIINGTIFEFKKAEDLSKALSQVIAYLSKRRIAGKSIPADILIVFEVNSTIYHFKSSDYLSYIEQQYNGAASKITIDVKPANYNKISIDGYEQIAEIIRFNEFIPVHCDQTNVIGLSNTFYKSNPKATKKDYFDELRSPTQLNIYPWDGAEEDFAYIQDCLNAPINRKDLGAFYTPPEYAELGRNLVREAIARIQESGDYDDYVIIDTCAGTGNLEEGFNDAELSHCVLNTYETIEWMVLNSKLGDKVREILPIEFDINKPVQEQGNALAYKVLPSCKKYVNDPRCAVIVFENPPYKHVSSDREEGKTGSTDTYIKQLMKKQGFGKAGNNLGNQFIFKAVNYYLQKPEDCYIVYSPVQYYTTKHLVNLRFNGGFLLNRKKFHATEAAISLISWQNIAEDRESVELNIEFTNSTQKIQKAYEKIGASALNGDGEEGLCCEANGQLSDKKLIKFQQNGLASFQASGFTLDANHFAFTRLPQWANSARYTLTENNLLADLPLTAGMTFPVKNWWEKEIYAMAGDGKGEYKNDTDFIKSFLIFTCLSLKNKCLAIDGLDGRFYQNELCLLQDTVADAELAKFELTYQEKELLGLWQEILDFIAETDEYNPEYNYNPWHISQEIDVGYDDGSGKITVTKGRPAVYPELHAMMTRLDKMNKAYYMENIYDKLFKYELIK